MHFTMHRRPSVKPTEQHLFKKDAAFCMSERALFRDISIGKMHKGKFVGICHIMANVV